SIRRYLETHRGRPVETEDLLRSIYEATGRDVRRDFDQWVFGRGHPSVKASLDWDDERKVAKVTLEQTQDPAGSRDVFVLDLAVAFACGSERVARTMKMEERKQSFLFPLASKPDWVAIDPQGFVLMTLDVSELPADGHAAALEKDDDPITRVRAARVLGKKG